MNIAVIGGGITGLTAAYELTKNGHNVTIFERDDHLGGLAAGFTKDNWDWHIESAYHHMFTNDDAILSLTKEIGIGDKLIYKRPITANLLASGAIAQLDSPLHLLQFPGLSLLDKLRTGALAAFCKLYPFWQSLEGVTAKDFFTRWGGSAGWRIIWEPLMTGKFGDLDDTIAASWLWARIHKRTPSLVYYEGGFQTFVSALERAIVKQGGTIYTSIDIISINKVSRNAYTVSCKNAKKDTQFTIPDTQFEKVLLTTPTPIACKLLDRLPITDYRLQQSLSIPHLHAQVVILETKEPILKDVYWLSITDRSFPFLAVVAHTNFMDKKYYGGNHITYIGNYLPDSHPFLKMNTNQILQEFSPYIKKISRLTSNDLRLAKANLFTAPYAQPVHQLHYSQKAPKMETTIPGLYLANMDSIYPWDRGTNYAVELGQKAATSISPSRA